MYSKMQAYMKQAAKKEPSLAVRAQDAVEISNAGRKGEASGPASAAMEANQLCRTQSDEAVRDLLRGSA